MFIGDRHEDMNSVMLSLIECNLVHDVYIYSNLPTH